VALALLWELTSPEVWTSAVSSCNCKRQKEDQTLFILCPKSFLFGRGFRPPFDSPISFIAWTVTVQRRGGLSC